MRYVWGLRAVRNKCLRVGAACVWQRSALISTLLGAGGAFRPPRRLLRVTAGAAARPGPPPRLRAAPPRASSGAFCRCAGPVAPSCGGPRRPDAILWRCEPPPWRCSPSPGAGGRLRAGLWRAGGAGPDAFVLGCFRYAAEEEEEAGAEAQERARVLLERLREQARARQLRRQRDERPRGAGGEPAAGGEAPSPGSERRGRRREAAERAAGGSEEEEEEEDGGAAPAEGRGAGGGERGWGGLARWDSGSQPKDRCEVPFEYLAGFI